MIEERINPELALPEDAGVDVPCCPDLETERTCDVMDFHYRLIHWVEVRFNNRVQRVPVEITIHARIERCSGPLTLGDPVYSTTLFPGEKVRLFSMDRRTRFSFDRSTDISYRHVQTSEERFYMSAVSDFMSDLTIRDEARSSNTRKGSFDTHGETSGAIESFFSGPSVDVSGSYDAESTSTFMRELQQHAEASHHRSVEGVRTANAVSVGEVQTRTHAEGETEDHFESASREFSNPNRCHAVTFFFYQINKTQTVKFTIEAIRRRVIDPAGDTRVTNRPFISRGEVSVIPSGVLATDEERLDVERRGRVSAAEQYQDAVRLAPQEEQRLSSTSLRMIPMAREASRTVSAEPLPLKLRQRAVQEVDNDLAKAGLLDKESGEISEETRQRFSFERTTSLPTPGLLVRGCLDECSVCEPALVEEIKLDLEHKQLENQLLKRQIELLEKSQEYRCCPEGTEDETEEDEA